jgi:hypothetical protein
MFRYLRLLLFLVVGTTAALAQFGSAQPPGVQLRGRSFSDLAAAQKVLLSNYCRLDFEGARLEAEGWKRFKAYTAMRANPEYTRVTIVSRFDVESPETPSEYLTVRYQMMGFYQKDEGYTPALETDRVEFRVQEQNGNLLVAGATPDGPHVSARAAVTWMNRLLDDPKITDLERAHLKDARVQLNRLMGKPGAGT